MTEIILVLGGTRSGKSEIAEKIALESSDHVTYVATCIAGDAELKERVVRHQARRPKSWRTIEAHTKLPKFSSDDIVLLDCLSFFVFNIMEKTDDEVIHSISVFLDEANAKKLIIVSNDVSGALIPPDPVSRRYQDLLGRANQLVAAKADKVILAVAGLPLTIK